MRRPLCVANSSVLAALLKGKDGGIYNLSSSVDIDSLAVTRLLIQLAGRDESAIQYIKDRPGHDRRYALNSEKAKRELGWQPKWPFDAGLKQTFDRFVANQDWLKHVSSDNDQAYYRKQCEHRK